MSRSLSLRGRLWHCVRWSLALLATAFVLPAAADPVPDTCAIPYPSDASVAWTCHRIDRRDTLNGLFGSDWQDVLRFNRIDRRHIYPGVRIKVPADLRQVHDFTPMPTNYSSAVGDAKFILVNLTEQFLGAYSYGKLVMSFPITSGANIDPARRTAVGVFRVSAYDRSHSSSVYTLANSSKPYPMHYGLRFLITRQHIAVWLHGRDVPGFAASHGCIGLYDEQMQKEAYGYPPDPILEDARALYEWAIAPHPDDGRYHEISDGPTVQIIGQAPNFPPPPTRGAQKLRAQRQPAGRSVVASCGR